jgi:hypothetical protein
MVADTEEAHMFRTRRAAVLDLYQLVCAAFLFASPWLFAFSNAKSGTDDIISAILVGASSLAALVVFREWEEFFTLVLGLWILASPWVLHFQVPAATHINVGVGLVITYMAALELWLIHYGAPDQLPS